MKRKHWTEGEWKGLTRYACAYCAYASAGKNGLAQIKRHASGHLFGTPDPRRDEPVAPLLSVEGEFALDFASEEAVQEAAGLTLGALEYLRGQEPSGKGGYTVADVRSAAGAVTTEEG